MGVYDTLIIESGVPLPGFPDDLDQTALRWQTKDIGHPAMQTYKLTSDGRLLRQEDDRREKPPDEKAAEAAEHGFDSWDAYVDAVKTADMETTLEEDYPPGVPRSTVVAETFWLDHNQHGSFTFYASSPDDAPYDTLWTYEARFTRGQLDEIIFLGDRHDGLPDDAEDIRVTFDAE